MKIGIIVNNLNVSGGYQKLVLRLSEELERFGHKIIIYVLSVDKNACYPELINKQKIISLDQLKKNNAPERSIKNIFFGRFSRILNYKKLATLIDDDLDGLIINDEESLNVLNFYSRQPDSKVVWMLNNQLSNNFDNLNKKVTAQFRNINSIKSIILNILTLPDIIIDHCYSQKKIMNVDEFAVYDKINKNLVEKKIKKAAKIVYAGADLDSFGKIFKKRNFSKRDEYTMLSVGVFFPHRRYEDLVYAIKILKERKINIKLIIVGLQTMSPIYSKSIKELAIKLNVKEDIKFIEKVRKTEPIYENSDIFCFVNDGFTWGISVFEATASGIPVIITSNIGASDIIKNNESGWVVSPKNPLEIALAVENIINNPKKTKEICENAKRKTEDLLSWDKYAQRMLDLLN